MRKWVVDYAVKRDDGTIEEDLSINVLGKDLLGAYTNAAKEIGNEHAGLSFFIWDIGLHGDEDIDF